MIVREASNREQWDSFLQQQQFSPFLQSWTMGEVYADTGQKPIRLQAESADGKIVGICMAIIVPARRGKHLSIPYGPVVQDPEAWNTIMNALREHAATHQCRFLRVSPFLPAEQQSAFVSLQGSMPSPLHLLAEHVWYLPLRKQDAWLHADEQSEQRTEQELMADMRKTTRNLIRRAEKEGVTIIRSTDPENDLQHFLKLHEETRRRHGFTPYTDAFFRAQVAKFAPQNGCTLYMAKYQEEIIAASVHMHMGGETSYHHGASTHKYAKIPASYLLQWTAIQDALQRGDHTYSFWGIAPEGTKKHPFAGVTLFKRGFGGSLLELTHCRDIPLHPLYRVTWCIEMLRKWRRGF